MARRWRAPPVTPEAASCICSPGRRHRARGTSIRDNWSLDVEEKDRDSRPTRTACSARCEGIDDKPNNLANYGGQTVSRH